MNVRTRLLAAFAAYILLIVALSVYDVNTTRRAVESARALTEIASRLRLTTTLQITRINQIATDAEKYFVTRDSDYVGNLNQIMREFDADLQHLDSLNLTLGERAQMTPLLEAWSSVRTLTTQLRTIADADTATYMARLQTALDKAQNHVGTLANASETEMSREVNDSEQAKDAADQATLIVAISAVLLTVVLSAVLARSILEPLDRLAHGTREVSAGRFGHRLNAKGNDELAQVAREFNSMTERLEELDRLKREFVSKVSHDLKTPLSSMQETTRVMLDQVAGPITQKQRQLLAINLESGERLAGMLGKLLDLSRMEAGLQLDFQLVDVASIVQATIERIGEPARGDRVSFSASSLEYRLAVKADPEALAQVFDNLLENALKFSPMNARISVQVADVASRGDIPVDRWTALQRRGSGSDAVLVSVADHGPGIPDEEKERVFIRFYQTDAGRAVRARGVGLGLAICREIVVSHGGAIWVSDNSPHGSIFNVLLPAAARVSTEKPAPALSRDTAHRA